MKIRKILPLLIVLFVLVASLPVQAATLHQYTTTLTGDELYGQDIPTSGSYGIVGAYLPSSGSLGVVEDTDDNYVYQYTSATADAKEAMVVYTYSNKAADNNALKNLMQKMTARVKFSSVSGQVQFFTLSKAWNLQTTTDTGGVLIRNGGAYHYDMGEKNYVSFIENGTLKADTWYTVEVIYDFTGTGNYMTAAVYDENGMLIGTQEMTYVSDFGRFSAALPHLRALINFNNIPEDETVLVDDVALYGIEDYAAVTCTDVAYDEENKKVVFTFDSDIDTALIGKGNVCIKPSNPALDVAGKYSVAIADDTISVDVSGLPYAETFIVSVAGTAITEQAGYTVTTPEDPFESAVTDVAFADENGEEISAGDNVVATVTLENASNVDKDYIFVVTSWNSKDECVAIRALSGNIEVGKGIDEEYTVTLPAVPLKDAGSIIRISLVDDWFNMTPIGDVITFELGGADVE